jgi:histidinol-phosphate/aromatic aminotransferase/cobyric acid decarboxylase-like protein
LHKLGYKTYPSAGNFVLIDFAADGNDLIPYLAKQKIIVRDRRDIAPGHIRISIGTQEQMERLLKLIKRFQKSR